MKKLTYTLCVLLGFSAFVLTGCDSPDKVHVGDTVSISYTANFPDDTAFATTGTTFLVGSGQVIKGLDQGVLGMKVDGTKTLRVSPAQGYGALYDAMKIQKVSKFIFDKIKADTRNGTIQTLWNIAGIVKGIETDGSGNQLVLFDINLRETWDDLIYKVTLVSKK